MASPAKPAHRQPEGGGVPDPQKDPQEAGLVMEAEEGRRDTSCPAKREGW